MHSRGYVTYVGVVEHDVNVNPCNPTMVVVMKEGGCSYSSVVIHEQCCSSHQNVNVFNAYIDGFIVWVAM